MAEAAEGGASCNQRRNLPPTQRSLALTTRGHGHRAERGRRASKCGYERRKDSASRCVGLTIGASRPADQLADRALEAARSARPRCPSQCAAARSLPSADHHPRKAAAATRSSPTTSITAAVRHPSRPTCGRRRVHLWRRSTSRMRFGTHRLQRRGLRARRRRPPIPRPPAMGARARASCAF